MKSLIFLVFLALVATIATTTTVTATDVEVPSKAVADPVPTTEDGEDPSKGDAPNYDHHHDYCCYKIKKELEFRISVVEARTAATVTDLRKDIHVNLERLTRMEKRLEVREDLDFEQLQTEVGALAAVVVGVDGEVESLRATEHKHHEYVTKEIQSVVKHIFLDEQRLHHHLEIQDGRLNNVTERVEDLGSSLAVGHDLLERAAADRRALHNETVGLDAKLDHVSEMTMKSFAEVAAKFEETAAKLASLGGKEDDDASALAALTSRVNETDAYVATLAQRVESDEKKVNTFQDNFQRFSTNVSAVLAGQENEIQALKEAEVELKGGLEEVKRVAASNADGIKNNVDAIGALRTDMATQRKQVAANGEAIEALGNRLQQLETGFQALQKTLQQHRQDIVEEMKKLTAAIAN